MVGEKKEKYLLIDGGYVITMDPQKTIFTKGSILVKGDSIAEIGHQDEVKEKVGLLPKEQVEAIDASGSVVLPGLVSSHTHLFQTLYRGLADNMSVEDWVAKMIFPLSRYLGEEEAYVAAMLAILEMIRTGTTCFADSHYIHVDKRSFDGLARAVEESGIRGLLVRATQNINVPEEFKEDIRTAEKETIRCIENYNGAADDRIRVCPEALSLVEADPDFIKALHKISLDYNTGFHMHVAETNAEVSQIRGMVGMGAIEYLYELGVLGPSTLLAHCVWISPYELKLLASTRTCVAHNPVSNMFLADGFAAVPHMLQLGIPVGIGVDGAASNNSQDMFEAMKLCALQHRANSLNPMIMDAETVLELATIRSAETIRLSDKIGSLEKSKKADIIICDLAQIPFCPNLRPISNLVFSANGNNVSTVIVNGQILFDNGKFTTIDEKSIIKQANETALSIIKKAKKEELLH